MFLSSFYSRIYLFFLQTSEGLSQKKAGEQPKIRNNQLVTTSLFIALSCPCYLSQFYCCSPPNFLLFASLPCPVTRFLSLVSFLSHSKLLFSFYCIVYWICKPSYHYWSHTAFESQRCNQSRFVPDISFRACLSRQLFISVPILCQEKYRLSEAIALRSLVSMEPIFTPPDL